MAGFSVTLMKLDDELKHYLECRRSRSAIPGCEGGMAETLDATGAATCWWRSPARHRPDRVLTNADLAIGDGDHGIGMRRGFEAAIESWTATEPESVDAAFKAIGMAILSNTGGAAGAVFGTLFRAGAKAFAGSDGGRRQLCRIP